MSNFHSSIKYASTSIPYVRLGARHWKIQNQINHGRKKIHGNGEKGKTVTSLGHLGGRHLNQAGSREEGRAGSINWKNSIYCGSEVEKRTP